MSAPQLPPGTVVAQKYQLGGCLGYAGSSATYQAVSADGREVVLKFFDPGIRQRADIMGAIEQTYAATNALPQEVAVPLLDAGYDASTGAPFSVGERIPFPSLAQLVGQRPLTPDEVANILGVLANLLDQAHARQLFHHALKPTNVFVGFAQGYTVRVTDFGAGLARAAVPTQEGYALAAPWLAPEQVQGQVPAGAAADVFAVGLIMFFAMTGRSYWRSCQGALDLAGWQRELTGPRAPPSARALQLGAQLNSAFDGVLGCALSADPGQRYRSVRELGQAFEALAGAKAPESQATMAFPAGAIAFQQGGGEYPPPPVPTGGGYQAVGPAAGAPAQAHASAQSRNVTLASPYTPQSPQSQQQPLGAAQYPWGGQPQEALQQQGFQQQGQPQAPAQGSNPAYISTQPSADAQGPQLGETSAGRVIDPMAVQRRATPNRLAPVLVGLVAVLLIGSAGVAWVVMGRRSRSDAAEAAASASAASAAAAAPADTATAVEVASAAPATPASAAPADTASAAPADTGSAAPADSSSAAPDADAGSPESTLACDPECDEIKLDDTVIELGKSLPIPPGKHVIVATKSGYLTVKETMTVKPGEKVEKTFKLREKPTAPAGPAPQTGPLKPCGKFLKRGAGCR